MTLTDSSPKPSDILRRIPAAHYPPGHKIDLDNPCSLLVLCGEAYKVLPLPALDAVERVFELTPIQQGEIVRINRQEGPDAVIPYLEGLGK